MEGKMETIQAGIEAMKSEMQRIHSIGNISLMMEQFKLVMYCWDDQERERKKKSPKEAPASESTGNSTVTPWGRRPT